MGTSMSMGLYLSPDRDWDVIKTLYQLDMSMRMKMNFLFGDEYEIMKLILALPVFIPKLKF